MVVEEYLAKTLKEIRPNSRNDQLNVADRAANQLLWAKTVPGKWRFIIDLSFPEVACSDDIHHVSQQCLNPLWELCCHILCKWYSTVPRLMCTG